MKKRYAALASVFLVAGVAMGGCSRVAEPATPEGPAPEVGAVSGARLDLSGLSKKVAAIEEETGVQVGVAIFDGTQDVTAGSVGVLPAWSTIKVPIALVAQEHCAYGEAAVPDLTEAAIEWSDNDATNQLWSCIGPDAEAEKLVSEEIAKSGITVAPEAAWGATVWTLPGQARYGHYLASLPADNPVIVEMHKIVDEHRYGLGQLDNVPFKGGWSDAPDGSWHTRQFGFTTVGDTTYGIAIGARSLDGSEEDCQEALTRVADYLKEAKVD